MQVEARRPEHRAVLPDERLPLGAVVEIGGVAFVDLAGDADPQVGVGKKVLVPVAAVRQLDAGRIAGAEVELAVHVEARRRDRVSQPGSEVLPRLDARQSGLVERVPIGRRSGCFARHPEPRSRRARVKTQRLRVAEKHDQRDNQATHCQTNLLHGSFLIG